MLANILDLSQRTLCATLHLSAWTGQRVDRKATRTVQATHHTSDDSGKFAKSLLPKDALQEIATAHSRARATFNSLALPWLDEGTRIFPSSNLFAFRETMSKRIADCVAAYDTFARRYPQYLASAPARLGELFNAADYPSPDRVRSMFDASLIVSPVASGDFRITNISEDDERELAAQYEQAAREQLGNAQRELWERLADVLRKFAETMETKDKIFHGSTVDKVVELAKRAPQLSLMPDAALDKVCADVLARINTAHADVYRADDWARASAGRAARAALADVESKLAGAFV